MKLAVDFQIACDDENLPSKIQVEEWLTLALPNNENVEMVVRIVDERESEDLNSSYRQKDSPTNVLSFPFELPGELPADALENNYLGDLVICASVVREEAKQQSKTLLSHWAHMVIHGCLHLQGYDHIEPAQADEMEAIEIEKLAMLDINNPYEAKA